MATLYITEYTGLANVGSNFGAAVMAAQAPQEPELASQTVAIAAGHQESSPMNAATTVIRIHCDAICSILITKAGTAATSANRRLAANQTEYFGVPKGDGYIVSVITNT